jgi:hypothetical protein
VSLKDGQSILPSNETSTQQISVLSPICQSMESMKVVLPKFLIVDLAFPIPLPHKNFMYFIDLLQVESIQSTVQPMELIDAGSTGPNQPIDSEASASSE